MRSVCSIRTGSFHEVSRRDAYSAVPQLLEKAIDEFPLRVKFKGETGFDAGGVCREMFTCFWEAAYKYAFDGSSLLIPVLHPHLDMSMLPHMGLVLSHGYLLSGVFPTRIAFPALAYILLGTEVNIPEHILVQSFMDTLSSLENSVVKEALKCSGPITYNSTLVDVLSRCGCRTVPNKREELLSLILGICRFKFHDNPLAAMRAMTDGIPKKELRFWSSFSVQSLHNLYVSLCASPQRVLDNLHEPEELDMCQARVFDYLKQFIGNMRSEELRRFLRFTTGTSVLLSNVITVTFNSLSGLARRPIAHTCGSIIELPSSYTTYPEFEREFMTILADDDQVWQLNAV